MLTYPPFTRPRPLRARGANQKGKKMKSAVVYSTLTGNTKKVAEAVLKSMPEGCEIYNVNEAPDPAAYDFIALGFWVDKGMPDEKSKAYMARIAGKKAFTFFTLGAKPASAHAYRCAYLAKTFYGKGTEEVGLYFCQGAVDPKLIEMMRKMPAGPHSATPENEARWAAAAKHPDEADLAAAAEAAKAARMIVMGEDPMAAYKAMMAAKAAAAGRPQM